MVRGRLRPAAIPRFRPSRKERNWGETRALRRPGGGVGVRKGEGEGVGEGAGVSVSGGARFERLGKSRARNAQRSPLARPHAFPFPFPRPHALAQNAPRSLHLY
jgi:hypothetical protein